MLELVGGDAFINRWSLVPADIIPARNWITILTAMSCTLDGRTSWAMTDFDLMTLDADKEQPFWGYEIIQGAARAKPLLPVIQSRITCQHKTRVPRRTGSRCWLFLLAGSRRGLAANSGA